MSTPSPEWHPRSQPHPLFCLTPAAFLNELAVGQLLPADRSIHTRDTPPKPDGSATGAQQERAVLVYCSRFRGVMFEVKVSFVSLLQVSPPMLSLCSLSVTAGLPMHHWKKHSSNEQYALPTHTAAPVRRR